MEPQSEDIQSKNEESLRTLARAITLSQDDFSLTLAHCNYHSLQQCLMQQLKKYCAIEFKEITLKSSAITLYSTIRAALKDEQPSAVIISGLEEVSALETMLAATNHARDEFRKHFSFPLVLWVTDEVMQKFIRIAPDFTSWAGPPISFTIPTPDLIQALHQNAEFVFEEILKIGSGKFLGNTDLNLAKGSPRRLELESALRDLQYRREILVPELEASLQFLLGLDADTNGKIEESREYYEHSLELWLNQLRNQELKGTSKNSEKFQPNFKLSLTDNFPIRTYPNGEIDSELQPSKIPNPKLIECLGCVLFYLGLWWRKYATLRRSEYQIASSKARDYFQQCINLFEQENRPDLIAKFINSLGEVLQKLEQWDELDAVAKLAVKLHETYSDPIRLAYGYGLLAELGLSQKAYKIAEIYADLALKTNAEVSKLACDLVYEGNNFSWSRVHYQSLYQLLLAQAKQHLNQVKEAIEILETAKNECKPQYDPTLYIRILTTLRSLYFEKGRYLEAFRIKQEQSEIEYKYGFRAFIGASQLQPRCQVNNPTIAPMDKLTPIAQEIAASGRQKDINHLIERIGRSDCKLTVIHGPSGVGKSSLVMAGLVPALKQKAVNARDVLPLVLRVYTSWVSDLGQSLLKDLGTSLSNELKEMRNLDLPTPTDYPRFIINQLRKNASRNILTVLILDQIEEFFFVCTDRNIRCLLYSFLRDCLDIPFVKVILALREDYLHYLLECERCIDLDIINNNILDKKIRYYLGYFSPEDAKAVIHSLNERSQFYLESALIDKFVEDLAEDGGEVSPIELQVVGAQLHTEAIVTLEQYQHLGTNPKQKLVERFLQAAVKDCGVPNVRVALRILYLLTDENDRRPPKTRAELAAGLENLDIGSHEEKEKQLNLVLEILTKSGLLLLLPDAPADRYQLVHDYLVSFIRQLQQTQEIDAALEKERKQRELAEQQLYRVRQQRLQVILAGIFVSLLAFSAIGFALLAEFQRKQTERAEIEALSSLSSALLISDNQLGALVESVKVGQRLKSLEQEWNVLFFGINKIPSELKIRALGSLQQAVYRVQELNRIDKHNGTFARASFSPDGKIIVSANTDGTIEIWQPDGKRICAFKGHKAAVNSISFSPDSQTLASASLDGTIKVWKLIKKVENCQSQKILIKTLSGHQTSVNSISFSPDGKTLASASADGIIKLWQLSNTSTSSRTFEGNSQKQKKPLLTTFNAHKESVNTVSFSPDGTVLASAGSDQTIKLWSLADVIGTPPKSVTLLKTLTGHQDAINSISFSPNGKMIASASKDKSIKIWNLVNGSSQNFYGHTGEVNHVSFSPDGKTLASASADHTIKLWKLDGTLLKSLEGHTNWVRSVSFNPEGTVVVSVSDDNSIKFWRINSAALMTLPHDDIVTSISFSPNGQILASASADRTVKIWNKNSTLQRILRGHNDVVNSVSFSPNGQTLASASADKTIKLWSINGQLLHTFTGHTDWVNSVTFSPDGQTIASASADKTIKLWSINGQLLHTFTGHTDWVNSVTFSPDGKLIASASNDMTVKLWSRDGKLLKTFAGFEGHTSGVNDVTFSPNSQLIASASSDNTIKVWNRDGRVRTTLNGHLGRVTSVRFYLNGKTLTSSSADKTLKFWNLEDEGNLLRTLEGQHGSMNSVRFSPDGETIASASDENAVILWNFDLDDLLVRGCIGLHDYLKNPYANISPTNNRYICDLNLNRYNLK
jgi:WD40 repeat protein